ncbi:MAG: recombinase family protein [Vulcanimicrobiaceae bacterium]
MYMIAYENAVAIPYYRVSTQKQGRSALGLEAQQAAVEAFCAQHALTIDQSFTEIESGKRSDRPQLAKAFAKAHRVRGVVLIAKLDRLARDVHFISGLIKQGTPFICVDAANDDTFVLHIKASMAEEEAQKISARTKAALAAAKARGVKLGNPGNLTDEARRRGARNAGAMRKAQGAENHAAIRGPVLDAKGRGLSLRAIAKEVGASAMTVKRILDAETDGGK